MALSSSYLRSVWGGRCRGPWARVGLYGGARIYVRPATVEAVKAMSAVLARYGYRAYASQTGAYACRRIGGSSQWSLHSYGIAVDINWLVNPYGGYRRHIPNHVARALTNIRTNNGRRVWSWGGDWSGTKDWMHFQIDCRPSDLATGINWKTVSGTPSGNIPKPPVQAPAPAPKPKPNPIVYDFEDDFDMRLFRDHNGSVWILSGRERKHVKTPGEYSALARTWIPNHDMGPGSPFYNPIVSQVILNYTKQVD